MHPHSTISSALESRFWQKVCKTEGCWLWTGSKSRKGYGRIVRRVHGRRVIVPTHRISWEIHFGPVPANLGVLHHCDNPACVWPDHLWLGTDADNNRDMVSKGRDRHPRRDDKSSPAKLSGSTVHEIRHAYISGGHGQRGLARRFGVAQSTIWRAVAGLYDHTSTMLTIICAFCGRSFSRYPSQVGRYCSYKCCYADRKNLR